MEVKRNFHKGIEVKDSHVGMGCCPLSRAVGVDCEFGCDRATGKSALGPQLQETIATQQCA